VRRLAFGSEPEANPFLIIASYHPFSDRLREGEPLLESPSRYHPDQEESQIVVHATLTSPDKMSETKPL